MEADILTNYRQKTRSRVEHVTLEEVSIREWLSSRAKEYASRTNWRRRRELPLQAGSILSYLLSLFFVTKD